MTERPEKAKRRSDIVINQEDYLRALAEHFGVSGKALKKIGVSREALRRWREEEEFRDRESFVFADLEEKYLRLLEAHMKRDSTAIFFRLKSLAPERYDDGVRRERIRAEALTDPERIKPVTIVIKREERKPVIKEIA